MKKKFLAFATVAALAVSMFGTTAMAAETNEFEGVAAGSYEVEASLSCYMNAMGGADLGAELIKEAALVVDEDGDAAIKLTFNPDATWSTAYFTGQPAYVSSTGDTQCWNGTAWVDAITTAGPTIQVSGMGGATSDVATVAAMTFPVTEASETYNLAMNVAGTQFGGANKAVLSNGSACEATLTVEWEEATLESETYTIDVSWSPMGAMAPMLDVDAEDGTFNLYKAAEPETSKGSGTIAFNPANGEYTLNYENGNTTTFTYDADSDTITFTSKVWFGAASFNRTDDAGAFVTYTASVAEAEDSDDTTSGDDTANDNTASGDVSDDNASTDVKEDTTSDNTTSPSTGDTSFAGYLIVICLAAVVALGTVAKRRVA